MRGSYESGERGQMVAMSHGIGQAQMPWAPSALVQFGLYSSVPRGLVCPYHVSLLRSLLHVLPHSIEAAGKPGSSVVFNISS